ncbi:LLM class F420-dependent oxidoreductase, partial [Xylella fastidiosa subsp. multiplex]|nr:LLM class F420-dependent oxidoreductase [Xylella fastidiosa subsp. multiplex]
FGNGWKVNSELPHPDSFEQTTQFVTPEDVAASIPCGDDPDDFVEAVRPYAEAGFGEIALVQIGGGSQMAYLDWAEKTLLP